MLRYLCYFVGFACFLHISVSYNSTSSAITLSSIVEQDYDRLVNTCFSLTYKEPSISTFLMCMQSHSNGPSLNVTSGPCSDIASTRVVNGPTTCRPTHVSTKQLVVEDDGGKRDLYLAVTWSPCGPGIGAVTGYRISLDKVGESNYEISACHVLWLTRQLATSDKEARFTYIYPVDLGKNYLLNLWSMPIENAEDNRQKYEKDIPTKSCETIYYKGHCDCDARYAVPPPSVAVRGYDLHVSTPVAKECFHVEDYELQIEYVSSSQRSVVESRLLPNGNAILRDTLQTFYDYDDSVCNFTARIVMRLPDSYKPTLSTLILVEPWKPPQPNVTKYGGGHVSVWFNVDPEFSSIDSYEISLSKNKYKNGEIFETRPLVSTALKSEEVKSGVLGKEYYDLEPGIYSVRIREVRNLDSPTEKPHCFNVAKWGPEEIFKIKPLNSSTNIVLILGVSIPITLVFLALLVFCCLVAWRKGWCRKVPLPQPIDRWVDFNASIKLRSSNILLVWQADHRSPELYKAHANNIRHFAAYLTSVCGQDVKLDLFETSECTNSTSEWIQAKYNEIDFVVFVCPHFDYHKEIDRPYVCPGRGEFDTIYHYMKSDFHKHKSKFITIVLPYCNIRDAPNGHYLERMTSVYLLMEQIEEFFFHIQGISKLNPAAVLGFSHISKKEYNKTAEGAALQEGINKFEDLSSCTSTDSDSLSTENSRSNGNNVDSGIEMNFLSVAPVSSESTIDNAHEEEDTLLLRNNISNIVAPSLLETKDHFGQNRRIHPPPPLVYNPEEELALINQESMFIDAHLGCTCYRVPSPSFLGGNHHSFGLHWSVCGRSSSSSFHDFGAKRMSIEQRPSSLYLQLNTQSLTALNNDIAFPNAARSRICTHHSTNFDDSAIDYSQNV